MLDGLHTGENVSHVCSFLVAGLDFDDESLWPWDAGAGRNLLAGEMLWRSGDLFRTPFRLNYVISNQQHNYTISSHIFYHFWLCFRFDTHGCLVGQYLLSSQFRPVRPGAHTHWPLTQLPPFWHWRLLWHASLTTSQRSPEGSHTSYGSGMKDLNQRQGEFHLTFRSSYEMIIVYSEGDV